MLIFSITIINLEYYLQPKSNDYSNSVLRSNYLCKHSLHVLLVFCCLSRLLISILGFNTRTLKYVARSII